MIFCVLLLVIAIGLSFLVPVVPLNADHICYPVENYTTIKQMKHGNQTVQLNIVEKLHKGFCDSG